MDTLKKGDSGQQVRCLQILVGAAVDGDFGGGTEAKVKDYQSKHGLTDDGVVGPKTWDKLLKAA